MPSLFFRAPIHQVNILLDEDVLKTSSRCLLSSSLEDVFKMSSRRLHQDEYIYLTHTSSKCLDQDPYIRPGHTSSRRLQDVFKTSSKILAKTYSVHLKDVLKAFWRRLQDNIKTSCKDFFKTFSRRIINLNCLHRSSLCLGHISQQFMVSVENC